MKEERFKEHIDCFTTSTASRRTQDNMYLSDKSRRFQCFPYGLYTIPSLRALLRMACFRTFTYLPLCNAMLLL